MNHVDRLVRRLMLAHPVLYPDRRKALRGIFSGSGYVWDAKGRIQPVHPLPPQTAGMSFADLDERDAQLAGETPCKLIRSLHMMRLHEAKVARMVREQVALDIDVLCMEAPSRENFSYESMENMTLFAIEAAPWGRIDPEWLIAAEEFVETIRMSFNRTFHLHYDIPTPGQEPPKPSMLDRLPDQFRRLHDRIEAISEHLDAQSGKKEKIKALMDRLMGDRRS